MNMEVGWFVATGFGLVHLLAGKLRFLDGIPRSRWLSAAGGVSVAYVFLHIFPELKERQELLDQRLPGFVSWIEHYVYFISLISFVLFYCLERWVRARGSFKSLSSEKVHSPRSVFWVHICTFAAYNMLIGYLAMNREESNATATLSYFVALGLHFIVNDFALRDHHRRSYDHVGRWVLSLAVLVGALAGMLIHIQEQLIAVFFAMLAGGIILNVMKEELPEERRSSGVAFFTGALVFAILLSSG